jgi:hypothetical protein
MRYHATPFEIVTSELVVAIKLSLAVPSGYASSFWCAEENDALANAFDEKVTIFPIFPPY